MSFQDLLGFAATLGVGFVIYRQARPAGQARALATAAALPALYLLALLAGLPVFPLISSLVIFVFAGGWAALVLLSSRWLRQLGRERPAARAALVVALALLAWLPVALLRAHADAASLMHQRGSSIRGEGGQPPEGRADWYQLASAELRWRALLPLHPPCVTGEGEICARLDALGIEGHGWREGLGPALIAAGLACALMLPPTASRSRGLVGGLYIAYGGISAGITLVESRSFLNLEPLSWLFVLPGTPHWPGAVPVQLALAAAIVAAGIGMRRGLRWGPALALAHAAMVTLIAVSLAAISYNPGLLQWAYATTLSGSGGAAAARLAVPAAIVALHLRPRGRAPLGPSGKPVAEAG